MVKEKRGFTMIELMVVVLIIGLLAAIVLVNINDSRKKGRDARRKQDINTIQTALESYANDNLNYPADLTVLAPYLAAIPQDPINTDPYKYKYSNPYPLSNPSYSYALWACTENAMNDGVKPTGFSECSAANNNYFMLVGGL